MKTIIKLAALCVGLLPNLGYAHEGTQIPESVQMTGGRSWKTDAERLADKMSNIFLFVLKFEDATLDQVLAFLEKESIEVDPEGGGVNFVAALSEGVEPTITLNLRRISLLDTLRVICLKTETRYFIQGNAVFISNKDPGFMVTRIYPFQPSFTEFFAVTNRTTSLVPATRIFEKMGVVFPTGASAVYNPVISSVIIKNTSPNLEDFEKVLRQINDIPLQVQYSFTLAEVTGVELPSTTNGVSLVGTHLADLPDTRKKLLHTASLVGMTGTKMVYAYKDSGSAAKTISFRVHPIAGPDGFTVISKLEGRFAANGFKAELDTMVTQWDHGALILVLSSSSEKSKSGTVQHKALVLELHVSLVDPAGILFRKTEGLSLDEEK